MTFLRVWSIAAFSLLVACGGNKPDAGKADADKAKAAEAGEAAKEGEGEAAKEGEGDAAKEGEGDAAKEGEGDAAAKPKRQFDRERDKSGVLARTAAVLEAEEDFDNEKLRGLSHHAEKLPSVKAVCKHVTEVRETPDALDGCVKDTEHWLAKIGPEIYEDLAHCLLEAKTAEELAECEEAEHDIEVVLHGKTRGDGLDKGTCDEFYDHFEKLTMAEAGEQSKLVEDILEEVRADMIVTCMEQGTKAEIECAMKTDDIDKLEDCSPKLL